MHACCVIHHVCIAGCAAGTAPSGNAAIFQAERARVAGLAELTRVQGRVLRGDNVTYWVRGSPGGWVERGWRAEVTVGQVGLRGVGPVQRLLVPAVGGEVMGSRATTFGPV